MKGIFVLAVSLLSVAPGFGYANAVISSASQLIVCQVDLSSVTADFAERDRLPESETPESVWYGGKFGSWGPHAAHYPVAAVPADADPVAWRRARVIATAEKYIGLPYKHHHIPAWNPSEGPGLDCSNFTAWVYNYGLGIKFNSDVHKQAEGPDAPGRRLKEGESFVPGDLLYIMKQDRSEISHVVIFIDEGHIIDSHKGSVQIRPFVGWYKSHLALARRIIE